MGPWPEFGCGADTKDPSDCGPKSPAAEPGAWAEAARDPGNSVLPRGFLWRSSRRRPVGLPCLHRASRPPRHPTFHPVHGHGWRVPRRLSPRPCRTSFRVALNLPFPVFPPSAAV